MNTQRLVIEVLDKSGLAWLLRPLYAGQGVIFGFHRVVPPHQPSLMPGNDVSPLLLEEILTFLKRARYDFVSLSDLPERLGNRSRAQFAAFTFDDGYLDNLTEALPIFERFRAPYTIFPVSGIADGKVVPWWIVAEWMVLNKPEVVVESPDCHLRLPCGTSAEKRAALQELRRWGYRNPIAFGEALTAALENDRVPASEIIDRAMLSWKQMREMQQGGLASFGVHTVTHIGLTRLSDEQAFEEVAVSQQRLQDEIGVPIRHIAYPFGWCGPREFRIARELGLEIGVTVSRGTIRPAEAANPLALPRVMPSAVEHANGLAFVRASVYGVWNELANLLQARSASHLPANATAQPDYQQ